MSQYKVAVIVGSLRKDSFNRKLAHAIERMAPEGFSFEEIAIDALPLYNQDADGNEVEAVKRFRAQIAAADALLFVTPEYNRSISGVLKNALDQGSRPYGQSVWGGKPGAVLGVSVGAIGTALAQQHLRNILAYLDVPLLGQPEMFIQAKDGLFNDDGSIGEGSREFLQGWLHRYVEWVKKHAV
ncbi:NADPH-dependent FMN reductase [Comamonas antarctica]|uniref:NAD(P)H-dependent oxidoreductase n=1 Tax=Comamonas antarctica TaxID=2743470 RepID=A0A6N1X6E9_9BURK|nr:NAD(P)H-dependent oxidoreductase [Comamonas antarctica]QKV53425.1 NAD(P)H-dependent oxidoreductase [Comamonas antarctica]